MMPDATITRTCVTLDPYTRHEAGDLVSGDEAARLEALGLARYDHDEPAPAVSDPESNNEEEEES
jgi:hypothetical protein